MVKTMGSNKDSFTINVKSYTNNTRSIRAELIRRSARNVRVGLFDVKSAIKAYIAEVGDPTNKPGPIPPRPFISVAIDDIQDNLYELSRKLKAAIYDDDYERALIIVGKFFVELLRSTIRNAATWAQALAPFTVDKKGHDTILRDSDDMYNNIKYKVS